MADAHEKGYLSHLMHSVSVCAFLESELMNEKAQKRKAEAPRPKGPLSFIRKWLRERLPQEYDLWQVGCRQLPNGIVIAGEKVRPWLVLMTSRTNDLVLAHDIVEEEPSAALLWDKLVQAMQNPAAGEPHGPPSCRSGLTNAGSP